MVFSNFDVFFPPPKKNLEKKEGVECRTKVEIHRHTQGVLYACLLGATVSEREDTVSQY